MSPHTVHRALRFLLVALLGAMPVQAAQFDSDVISGVSAAITQGKTMEDPAPPPKAPAAAALSSQGPASPVSLTPFSGEGAWQGDMKSWELHQYSSQGLGYAAQLGKNPWPSVAVGIGSTMTRKTLGDLYYTGSSRWDLFSNWNLGRTYNELAKVSATAQGQPYFNTVGDAFARGKAIYSTTNTIVFSGISAASLFNKTITYGGLSMQTLNPPIYLHQKTSTGWEGAGSYTIPGGQVAYKETLTTSQPEAITRVHTETITLNTPTTQGTVITQTTTRTPVAEGMAGRFERYMEHRFPTGSSWDVNSTQTWTTTSNTVTRETIVGGYRVEPGSFPNMPRSVSLPTNYGNYGTYGTYGNSIPRDWGTSNTYKFPSAPTINLPTSLPSTVRKFGGEGAE